MWLRWLTLALLLVLSGCQTGHRLSVEGGSSIPLFAADSPAEERRYGWQAKYGMVSYMAKGLTPIAGIGLGASLLNWGGPYSHNTLLGGNIGYDFLTANSYFGRTTMGPYYGEITPRTSTHWTFGINCSIGRQFNGGANEVYLSFWHFSNGSDLGLSSLPNCGEEFIGPGFSFLF